MGYYIFSLLKKKKDKHHEPIQGWISESILISRPERRLILLLHLRDVKIKRQITKTSTVPVLEELVVLQKRHVHK